jgi:hypothetical protein
LIDQQRFFSFMIFKNKLAGTAFDKLNEIHVLHDATDLASLPFRWSNGVDLQHCGRMLCKCSALDDGEKARRDFELGSKKKKTCQEDKKIPQRKF